MPLLCSIGCLLSYIDDLARFSCYVCIDERVCESAPLLVLMALISALIPRGRIAYRKVHLIFMLDARLHICDDYGRFFRVVTYILN